MVDGMMDDEALQRRRQKLRYRSNRRGMRELDLVLGSYADRHAAQMDADALGQMERLLACCDPDLLQWIGGVHPAPDHLDAALLRSLRAEYAARMADRTARR